MKYAVSISDAETTSILDFSLTTTVLLTSVGSRFVCLRKRNHNTAIMTSRDSEDNKAWVTLLEALGTVRNFPKHSIHSVFSSLYLREQSIFMGIRDGETCNGTACYFDSSFERGHRLF